MRQVMLPLVAFLVLSGCGTSSISGAPQEVAPSSSTRMTITNPTLQPPVQQNTNGRPDVVFDPCTWVSDEVIHDIGFDPSTRKRMDYVGERTSLVCGYSSGGGQLLLRSVNTPYEGHVETYRTRIVETTAVNGRPAFVVPDDIDLESCYLMMKSAVGAVMVVRTLFDSQAPCEGIVEFAAKIEPSIGEGN